MHGVHSTVNEMHVDLSHYFLFRWGKKGWILTMGVHKRIPMVEALIIRILVEAIESEKAS